MPVSKMQDLKSLSSMTVTVNGVARPMTARERWLASVILYPLMSRTIAKELRSKYPTAGREQIAGIMRADLGADPDPLALKLVNMVQDRLPPPTGQRAALFSEAQTSPSTWLLVLANLIPVWGVLTLGWEVFPLLLLYWLENVIIGLLNVARMLCVDPGDAAAWGAKLFLVPFFCFHYGMFTFVHGVFVFALFGGEKYQGFGGPFDTLNSAARAVAELGLGLPVLALAGSHLFSFLWNYLLRGEYKVASLGELMTKPYSRVVILHLGILGSGFLIAMIGSPMWALLLMLVFKIFYDTRAHARERRQEMSQS